MDIRNDHAVNGLLCVLCHGLGLDPDMERIARMFPANEKADPRSAFFVAPDWEGVFRLAVAHRVVKPAWDGIQQLLITGRITNNMLPDNGLIRRWIEAAEQREQRYEQQKEVVCRLGTFYARHNVRMLLLNGWGLSLCYPTPSARECGDVDVWLHGDQHAADALLENAWRVRVVREPSGQSLFRVDPVLVENHCRLPEADLLGGCRERAVGIGGVEVWLPEADLGLLYLLRHTALKFRTRHILMRHLTDWALYVRAHRGRIDWERIRCCAGRLGIVRFLDVVNTFCVEFLGVGPDCVPRQRATEKELRLFAEEVVRPRFPWKLSADAPWAVRAVFGLCRRRVNWWKRRFVSERKCRMGL